MSECYWIKDRAPDGDLLWNTTCGNIHQFTDGGPAENSHRFCPYCGGKIGGTVEALVYVGVENV